MTPARRGWYHRAQDPLRPMRPRTVSRSWPLAWLLVFTGACSIFTNLSELTDGATSAGGAGGRATSTSATSASATSASGAGGATASSASAGGGLSGCSGMNQFERQVGGSSRCYFYDPNGSIDSFSLAQGACSAWAPGGHLAVAENASDWGFLINTVHVQKDTWIGLSDQVTPGTYQWVTGAALTFADWDPGFPDDTMGHCVGIASTGMWQNVPCGAGRITLCERP